MGTSPQDLQGTLERVGIPRAAASTICEALAANAVIRDDREQPSDQQMCGLIETMLSADPYLRLNYVRRTGQPAPEPTPEPVLPAQHENPVAEGTYPAVVPYDPAAAIERAELEALATGKTPYEPVRQ